MTPERHVWACANTLIEQHGDSAWFHASQRADELLAANDMAGYRMFLDIIVKIDALQKMGTSDKPN